LFGTDQNLLLVFPLKLHHFECVIIVLNFQEDLPHTPPSVYSQSNLLSHGVVEEAVDHNGDSRSLCDPLISTSNGVTSTPSADYRRASSNSDPSVGPDSRSSFHDRIGSADVNDSNITTIESEMKALFRSNPPNPENQKNQEQWQHGSQNNILQPLVHQLQNNFSQVQTAKSQVISQGVNCTYVGADQFLHNPSKFTVEVQPVLQSSGFTPPLYATAAAYMTSANHFYPNLQAPGLYPPQYVGGYALNPASVPPYIAGYSPHGAAVVVDGTAGPSYTAQTPGVSTGGNIAHGADMQHLGKFYGQFGFPLQPSFGDPVCMQYHQQLYGEAFGGISGQFDPLASRGGIDIGSQVRALDSQKGSSIAGYLDDHKFHQINGGSNKLNPRRGGMMSPNYGNPTNMGFLMQYANSPLASPVLPGSPVGGTGVPGGRNEMRGGPASGRNAGVYPGWQGQRGFESFDDPKIYNFLEELKSGKGRRFELSDIVGHIVEFRQVLCSVFFSYMILYFFA
jgi:pumilio RNA-binding family